MKLLAVFIATVLVCILHLVSTETLSFAIEVPLQVISVIDGDTIEVLNGHHAERIRLSGIDCPEKGQAFGKRAKQAASDLAFGKEVTIQTHGYDKYKRTLADVILSDGTNINHTLVKDGWCWWFRKYAPGDTVLEELETEAREARKGLWADPQPVPPWEWRKARRGEVLEQCNQEALSMIWEKVAAFGNQEMSLSRSHRS